MKVFNSRKPVATRKAMLSVATATALLASASFAVAGEGYGFIKSDVAPLVPLEIRIKKIDGNMSLRNDSLSIPIQYEAGYKGYYSNLRDVNLRIEHISKGNGAWYELRRDLETQGDKDKVWGTTVISLNRAQIEPMEKYGKELCASHTGNQDKRTETVIPLVMHVSYEDDHTIGKFTKAGLIPVTIVCEPDRPSNPAKLLQLQLGTTAQQCHKPIALTALFAATLPAHYKFKLQRDDGAAQDATVFPALKDGPVYRGQWTKVYTFSASETRKYRIVSETFAPLTDWVTISVNCPVSHNAPLPNRHAQPPRQPSPQHNARPVHQRMPVAPQQPRPQHLQNLKNR